MYARSQGTTKQSYKCTHCDQTGHTKERCYELVGYPEWWDHNCDSKKRGIGRNTTAALTEGTVDGDNEVAKPATALIATEGKNIGKTLNMFILVLNNTWIIDSGATDHMTFDSNQILSLSQSSQKCVSTANGASTPVIGEGVVSLTDTLNLESVLVVPSLEYNLLSVAQITLTLHCVVIFLPDFCVFKDMQTRQTIGYGVRRGKLYYLDLVSKSSDKLSKALAWDSFAGEKKKAEIWLWHRRSGYASFGYLKKLFPSLFSKVDISIFHCEVCELAKSHRVSFPITLNKSPVPFILIHSMFGVHLRLLP